MEFPREKEQFVGSSNDFRLLVGQIVPCLVLSENREVQIIYSFLSSNRLRGLWVTSGVREAKNQMQGKETMSLSSLRHYRKQFEEHLVAIAVKITLIGHHGFHFIGQTKGEHRFGFFFFDIGLGEDAIEGLPHIGGFGRVQLFLDSGEEFFDSFVHGD